MIYTIGYSNRALFEFTKELEKRSITKLVDVRSRPWSRNPAYNRKSMERWTETLGVQYCFAGEVLGGMSDFTPYDADHQTIVDDIIRSSINESIAIMCAEGDPAKCHRTWSVAVSILARHEIDPISILRDGQEERASYSLTRVSQSSLPPFTLNYLDRQKSLF